MDTYHIGFTAWELNEIKLALKDYEGAGGGSDIVTSALQKVENQLANGGWEELDASVDVDFGDYDWAKPDCMP